MEELGSGLRFCDSQSTLPIHLPDADGESTHFSVLSHLKLGDWRIAGL